MAGWTDYADWSSAATLKLTASYNLLHPIVESINEHIRFTKLRHELIRSNFSQLETIQKLDIYDYRQLYQGINLQWYQLLNMLSAEVFSRLASTYHNHLRNPITEGLPSFYEINNDRLQFKEASLLAAIGDSERYIVQPNDTEIPAAWAFQMYKALNMLRYTMTRYIVSVPSGALYGMSMTDDRNFKSIDYSSDYSTARQTFINAAYNPTPGGSPDGYGAGSMVQVTASYGNHYLYAWADSMTFSPVYDCAIYATEYPLGDYIKVRKADFFGLGSNKAILLGDYTAGDAAEVAFPYPDLSLIPTADPENGYSNGVFFAAIIDGRSGDDGFEFFEESA